MTGQTTRRATCFSALALLASASVSTAAQVSAADSATLLMMVTNRVRAEFTSGEGREPIALRGPGSRSVPGYSFAMRVAAAVWAADSARITQDSSRYSVRVSLGGLTIEADTARFGISRAECRASGRMLFHSVGYSYVFLRDTDGSWSNLPSRYSVVGDGFSCPWRNQDFALLH